MKMNKILSMFMFVIALSALAIKSEAALLDKVTKTTKENVNFSEMLATQRTFNVSRVAMTDLEKQCRANPSFISYSPPSLYYDAMGGTSKASLRFIPDINWNQSCNGDGWINFRQFVTNIPPRKALNLYTYGMSPRSSLSVRRVTIRIGGKNFEMVQGPASTTPFSLFNWVRRKIIDSVERKQCKANDRENPCSKNGGAGIRG